MASGLHSTGHKTSVPRPLLVSGLRVAYTCPQLIS